MSAGLKVYELRSNVGFAGLRSSNFASAFAWRRRFDGQPLIHVWERQRVSVDRTEDASDPGDFPDWGATVPVFSQRAVEHLGQVLRSNGELLPLESTDGGFWAYNVTAVIDALDESRSSVQRFDGSERVMNVERYAFRASLLEDHPIFKIPQLRTSRVFVTDGFVKLVEHIGLQGFEFAEVWSTT